MAIIHAQGLFVSFDGDKANDVISCNVSGGEASLIDATPLNAAVIGSGEYARCVKGVLPASVEPVTVSVTMYGVGLPFSGSDRGKVANLVVSKAGLVNYTGQAVLLSNDTSMSAGEFPQQTVTFSYLY
jgi:hypothetical protein